MRCEVFVWHRSTNQRVLKDAFDVSDDHDAARTEARERVSALGMTACGMSFAVDGRLVVTLDAEPPAPARVDGWRFPGSPTGPRTDGTGGS